MAPTGELVEERDNLLIQCEKKAQRGHVSPVCLPSPREQLLRNACLDLGSHTVSALGRPPTAPPFPEEEEGGGQLRRPWCHLIAQCTGTSAGPEGRLPCLAPPPPHPMGEVGLKNPHTMSPLTLMAKSASGCHGNLSQEP